MGAPVPVEDGDQADVLDLLGSESERSQMLQRFGVNDFIAGEGWLVGMPKQFLIPQVEEDDGPLFRLATEVITAPAENNVEALAWPSITSVEVENERGPVTIGRAAAGAADTQPK